MSSALQRRPQHMNGLEERGFSITYSRPAYGSGGESRWLAPIDRPSSVDTIKAQLAAGQYDEAAKLDDATLDAVLDTMAVTDGDSNDAPAGLNEFSPAVPLAKGDDGVRGGQGNTAADVRKAVGVDQPRKGGAIKGLGNVVKLYAIVAGAAVAAWWIGAPVLASVGIGVLAGALAVAFVAAGR